jgi:hypothetical protein
MARQYGEALRLSLVQPSSGTLFGQSQVQPAGLRTDYTLPFLGQPGLVVIVAAADVCMDAREVNLLEVQVLFCIPPGF